MTTSVSAVYTSIPAPMHDVYAQQLWCQLLHGCNLALQGCCGLHTPFSAHPYLSFPSLSSIHPYLSSPLGCLDCESWDLPSTCDCIAFDGAVIVHFLPTKATRLCLDQDFTNTVMAASMDDNSRSIQGM